MRKIDTGQVAATLANIGVIVGIIFLIVEIQQANKIATVAAEIEIRALFSEVNEALYAVPGFSDLLVKAQDQNAELTAKEKIRAKGFVLRLTNVWQAVEIAYVNDILPIDTFSVIEDDVRSVLTAYPAFAPMFRQNVDNYPGQGLREVYQIIDKVLEEQGH